MYRSLTVTPADRYIAVSYQSSTFDDLKFFMQRAAKTITRLEPDDFLLQQATDGNYINLVTKFPLRQKISEHLDILQAKRFNVLVDCFVADLGGIGAGCFIYPGVVLYPSTKIASDVIIHSNTVIAHQTSIGQGCFISGQVGISGSVNVGDYCWLAGNTMITDHVVVASGTQTHFRSVIVKDIIEKNTIYRKHT